MTESNVTGDGRTVTVHIPISIRRRGGRKLVLAPDGTDVPTATVCQRIDNAMVKADRPGVPLAGHARERHPRDHRGDRHGREDQRVLRRAHPAANATGAGRCRCDPAWAAAGGCDAGDVDAAVSDRLARAADGCFLATLVEVAVAA
jgi:hypothetical protein